MRRPRTRSRCPPRLDFDADRLLVVDEHAVDQTVRPDGEVAPLAGGQQVGDRGGEAQAAAPVLWEGADAGCLRVVVVGDLGEAEAAADLEEGALGRNQLFARRQRRIAIGPPRPWSSSLPSRVVFQATKVRQHLRPAPGVVAQRGPLVVVRGHAAQGDRGVDGRGAADHPAARIGNDPAGDGLRAQSPVVRLQRHPPAVLKIVGRSTRASHSRGPPPADRTRRAGSSDSRAASTAPAEPPPTMMSSYSTNVTPANARRRDPGGQRSGAARIRRAAERAR